MIWVFNLIDEVDEERLKWYEETNNGAKWQWKNPRKTFMSVVPQRYKKTTQPSSGDAVILFVQIAEQTEEEGVGYMERITWARPSDYEESTSDYSRFITKYDVCTALELKEAIIDKAL